MTTIIAAPGRGGFDMDAQNNRCAQSQYLLDFTMFASIKVLDIAKKACLLAFLANVEICATAATVKIVAEGPALANAKMTETERSGSRYLGQHVVGFVGDTFELEKGVHHISLDAPKDYIFDFSILVGDKGVTVDGVSIRPINCKPELQASWSGPKVAVNKDGTVTLVLATPQFGPPNGKGVCAAPAIVPCEMRRVALDVQTSPRGAEIWIEGKKQSVRTNHVVETAMNVCENTVDVLLRLPGKPNCFRKVSLLETSPAKVTCAFARGNAR